MGVSFLYNNVKKQGRQSDSDFDSSVNLVEAIDITVKNVLIIDAACFTFHALNLNNLEEKVIASLGFERLIKKIFQDKLDFLMKTLNFEVIFVKDGDYCAFRDPNDYENKKAAAECCLYETSEWSRNSNSRLLRNPFISKILVKVLTENQIEIIWSDYEADLDCTIKCKELNANFKLAGEKRKAFCCSTDADFILMPEALTIHPDDLNESNFDNEKKTFKVNVYSRKKAARRLKFNTEDDLVKACIYFGNDFTKHQSFSNSNYNVVFSTVRKGTYRPRGFSTQLEKDAFNYSMAFYNHDMNTIGTLFKKYKILKAEAHVELFLPSNYKSMIDTFYKNLPNEELEGRNFLQDSIDMFLRENEISKRLVTETKYNPIYRTTNKSTNCFTLKLSDNLFEVFKALAELDLDLSSLSVHDEELPKLSLQDLEKISIDDLYFINRIQYALVKISAYLDKEKSFNFDCSAALNMEKLFRWYLKD